TRRRAPARAARAVPGTERRRARTMSAPPARAARGSSRNDPVPAARRDTPLRLLLELQGVPRRHRRELEQRAPTPGMLVGELVVAVVPHDLERAALHLVVEPGASEDQLAQPVDERLAADEGQLLPVAHEVATKARRRLLDDAA